MKKLLFLTCFLFTFSSALCFGGENVSHDAYFDSFTGHKYIKLDASTYAEYSQKGVFLKEVPSDLPLLAKRSNIHPIPNDSYILYEKASCGVAKHKFLSKSNDHPKGWKAKKVFVSMN
jgi:hypothetical protein